MESRNIWWSRIYLRNTKLIHYLLPSENVTIVLAVVYFNYPSLICYLTGSVGQEPRHSLFGSRGYPELHKGQLQIDLPTSSLRFWPFLMAIGPQLLPGCWLETPLIWKLLSFPYNLKFLSVAPCFFKASKVQRDSRYYNLMWSCNFIQSVIFTVFYLSQASHKFWLYSRVDGG